MLLSTPQHKKAASVQFDIRQFSTLRLYQSMIATHYRTPRRIHCQAADLQGKSAERGM